MVPYQLAPPQSGSNWLASAPSYDVEPRVALPRRCAVAASPVPPASAPVDPDAPADPAPPAVPVGPDDLARPADPARAGARPRAARRSRAPGPPAIGSMRRVRACRVSRRWPGRRPRHRLRRPLVDELFVGRLDREEARQRLRPGGVRVVLLGELAVGALDLVEARPARQAERAVRIGRGGHAMCSDPRRPGAQPMSSPTGASSNSAIDSAATRPCGSRDVGR